jgi:FKBP-type peptidyl-prolyl cis-trans isomerase
MRRILLLAATLPILAACESDPAGPADVACPDFLASYGAVGTDTVTAQQGVRYVDVQVGSGAQANLGSLVDVNYSLYQTSGAAVESSCPAGVPVFQFVLGETGVIPGFQIGVIGMGEGGIRRVFVPSNLAYNNGDLIFDIQLVTVR